MNIEKQIALYGAANHKGRLVRVVPAASYETTGAFTVEFTHDGKRSYSGIFKDLNQAQVHALALIERQQ